MTGSHGGLVVVDKPAGMTSHDVVARARRILGTRKVGHAGTLDPMATGVLVLGADRATRLLGHLTLATKTYDATIRLGVATDSDDADGTVLASRDASGLHEADVRAALAGLVGEIDQVPASVSAVKVGGRRAYDRVRDGEHVELPARRVTVHALDVHDLRPGPAYDVDVSVRCSSGTYVRALARDAGAALGVGGHLTALRRTTSGPFTLEEAVSLDRLGDESLLGLAEAARRCFPAYDVSEGEAVDVRHGRALDVMLPAAGPVALFAADGTFLALYRSDQGRATPVAVFVG